MSKTILITGATDGIGLLTAKMLTDQGHKVLLHGRSNSKLDAVATEVGGDPATLVADLSKLTDIGTLAKDIQKQIVQLDVLINNAGVLKAANTTTELGWDLRFVVNTFAPYLLTRLLLPIVPADGRVVNLSSAAQAPFEPDVMLGKSTLGDDLAVYAQSKLGITLWSQELAHKLPNGPVVVSVNPGSLLATKMVKEGFGVAGNDLTIGADILIKAALDASFADASGKYYDNDAKRFSDPHAAAQNAAHCQMVMQLLDELAQQQVGGLPELPA